YNRYYNPDTGRYITTDPLGLTPSPNPHTYVTNPTTGIDPLGLSETQHGLHNGGATEIRPPLSISAKQFGAKWGKHAADYGLDPASSSSRSWFMNRAREVHLNPDEVRRGAWNPHGGGGDNYFFFRQGDDLLITRAGGEFVTMFPGGGSNGWFKSARVFPH
ncbi:MAG: hypothetical protein K4304_09165, partial [Propionicimonas sp.]